MGWDPIKDAKKWINKIKNEGNSIVNKIKNEGNSCINKIKDEANKGGKQIGDSLNWARKQLDEKFGLVKKELDEAAHTAVGEVEGAANTVKREVEKIPETVKKEVTNAFNEIAKLAQGQVYKTAANVARQAHKKLAQLRKTKPNLVGYIDALAFSIKVGPVNMVYGRFYDRAEDLIGVFDRLANEPPKLRRRDIIGMIEATGPDSTDLGISVNLAALVVSSDDLGAGFELPAIPLELVGELTDLVLKEIGIPE